MRSLKAGLLRKGQWQGAVNRNALLQEFNGPGHIRHEVVVKAQTTTIRTVELTPL